MLPDNLDSYSGLRQMNRMDVTVELSHEIERYAETHNVEDNRIGIYTPEESEHEFNRTLVKHFSSEDYWIRVFAE